jgi:hypothetical protein
MCGLHEASTEDDGITIVAEPSHTEHHHASPASLNQPCRMECGACTISSGRQQKRERAVAQTATRTASPLVTSSYHEDLPRVVSSNDEWPQVIPRGPPASSLQ